MLSRRGRVSGGRRRVRRKRGNRGVVRVPTRRARVSSSPWRVPSNDCDITVQKRITYNVVTSGHVLLKNIDILNMVVLPASALTAYCLLKAAKIYSISVWAVTSTGSVPQGSGGEVIVTWHSELGKEESRRGTQIGTSPAFVKTSPPMNSLSSFWINIDTVEDSQVLVDIFTPQAGSIVSITYGLQFCNDNTARLISIAAGVLGEVSYNNYENYTTQGYQDYAPASIMKIKKDLKTFVKQREERQDAQDSRPRVKEEVAKKIGD